MFGCTLDNKRGTHNTIIHYLFCHTYFFHFNLHIADLYTHNCLYYILCFCHFVHCLFVYLSFIICVLSRCCDSVALLSVCHYNKFLICVYLANKAHSHFYCIFDQINSIYKTYTAIVTAVSEDVVRRYMLAYSHTFPFIIQQGFLWRSCLLTACILEQLMTGSSPVFPPEEYNHVWDHQSQRIKRKPSAKCMTRAYCLYYWPLFHKIWAEVLSTKIFHSLRLNLIVSPQHKDTCHSLFGSCLGV